MSMTMLQYAALVPDLKRRGVVEVFVEDAPLLDLLQFIDLGEAFGYEYNREAALGGIGFRLLNGDYPAAASTLGVVNPIKEGTAIMGGLVPLDRQHASNRAVKANQIAGKVKAARKVFCEKFIHGDSATAAAEFDGLYKRLAGTASEHHAAAHSAAGDYLDLAVLRHMINRVPGLPSQKLLLMGEEMIGTLEDTCLAQAATGKAVGEWKSESDFDFFHRVKIVDPGEDEAGDPIMDFDEPKKDGTGSTLGSILCVRPGGSIDGEYLQGIARLAGAGVFEVEEQGVSGTADRTLVEGRVGIVIHHPRCVQRYRYIKKGVATS